MAGQPNRGTGPRPHTWVTGPDLQTHLQYRAWLQSRAQANFRAEPWSLAFPEYQLIWEYRWHLRGRTRDTLCLTRTDPDSGWSSTNCELITRAQHSQRQASALRLRRALKAAAHR